MARFWMRWFGGKDGDPRPVTFPTPIEWWCTGEASDGSSTICAIVDAPTVYEAWKQVKKDWPEARYDFADLKLDDWRPPASRFPVKAEK